MQDIIRKIEDADWQYIAETMHEKGYAILPGLLSDEQCASLKAGYNHPDAYRKTVVMERHQYGRGEYKYFHYPLPDIIQQIRTVVYPKLAPIANAWCSALNMDTRFPSEHAALLQQCHNSGQRQATVLILKYGKGGFNALHQDLYGDIYFPLQCVVLLNEPNEDFTGGAFVLVQQMPRAQSKAVVIQPGKGDLLIFTTNFKPQKSIKGYRRVNMKHGVSEVHSGERYTLGIIFHDAG